MLFLNRKNHWRINTQSERPQEQVHRQADVSMQNFGKRPDSMEKTLNAFFFFFKFDLITISGRCACNPIVWWFSP